LTVPGRRAMLVPFPSMAEPRELFMAARARRTRTATQRRHPETERRAAQRLRCLRECLVRVEGGAAVDGNGMAYDVSAHGIGLALPFPVPEGAVLVIEPLALRGPRRAFRARVARCVLQEYVWFHGCAFLEPLSEEQLRMWTPDVGRGASQAGGQPFPRHPQGGRTDPPQDGDGFRGRGT
jgi:PilZ domain